MTPPPSQRNSFAGLTPQIPPFIQQPAATRFSFPEPPAWQPATEAEIQQHLEWRALVGEQFSASVAAYLQARDGLMLAHLHEYVVLADGTFALTGQHTIPARSRRQSGQLIDIMLPYYFKIGEEVMDCFDAASTFFDAPRPCSEGQVVGRLAAMAEAARGKSRGMRAYMGQREALKAAYFGEWVAIQDTGSYVLTGKRGKLSQFDPRAGPGGVWYMIGQEHGQEPPEFMF